MDKVLRSIALTLTLVTIALPAQAMVLSGGVEQSVVTEPEKGIVGMDIHVPSNGYPVVKQVFHAAPASVAGLKPGDRIIKIDGQLTYGKTARAIDLAISDIPGTPVSITVKRDTGTYQNVLLVVAPLSRTDSHIQGQYMVSRPDKG